MGGAPGSSPHRPAKERSVPEGLSQKGGAPGGRTAEPRVLGRSVLRSSAGRVQAARLAPPWRRTSSGLTTGTDKTDDAQRPAPYGKRMAPDPCRGARLG